MFPKPFSVDPSGYWSPRQAEKVVEAIWREAEERGLYFVLKDSVVGNPKRVMLVAHCIKHGRAIPMNSACDDCIRESPYSPRKWFQRWF